MDEEEESGMGGEVKGGVSREEGTVPHFPSRIANNEERCHSLEGGGVQGTQSDARV